MNTKDPNRNRQYSKLHKIFVLHPEAIYIPICIFFASVGVALLFVVSRIRHWDITAVLTSPTAYLIYAVGGALLIMLIFKRIFKRW